MSIESIALWVGLVSGVIAIVGVFREGKLEKVLRTTAALCVIVVCGVCLVILIGWLRARPATTSPEMVQNNVQPPISGKKPPILICPATPAEVKRIQKEWADYLKLPVVLEEDLGLGVKSKMVLIPPGKFRMGDTDDKERIITISKPFYLGMYEVTRGELRKFVETGQHQNDEWKTTHLPQKDEHPVVYVSWGDAQAFCNWLSQRQGGMRKGRTITLPSEAQWEYACRAGSSTKYSFGDDAMLLPKHGNSDADDGYQNTAPVGKFQANAFGLFDMHGNVWEWCMDFYGPLEGMPLTDPAQLVKQSNDSRVVRGGSWRHDPVDCRSAFHSNGGVGGPAFRGDGCGFRFVVLLD